MKTEFYLYTYNMLPMLQRLSETDQQEWNPVNICEYLANNSRSRLDYAIQNQWFTYREVTQ